MGQTSRDAVHRPRSYMGGDVVDVVTKHDGHACDTQHGHMLSMKPELKLVSTHDMVWVTRVPWLTRFQGDYLPENSGVFRSHPKLPRSCKPHYCKRCIFPLTAALPLPLPVIALVVQQVSSCMHICIGYHLGVP